MVDFGRFALRDVILHRVPQARPADKASNLPEFSEATVDLDPRDRTFLQQKMRATLGSSARPVVEDSSTGSTVPAALRGVFGGTVQFVPASREVALRLHNEQPGISSAGLLLMMNGTLEREEALLVAKVEHEEGMRVESTTNAAGLRTYKTEYLHDLIFGQNTKVYKVGVFTPPTSGSLAGHVVDVQQAARDVAQYFVRQVLGCRFTERPDVQTQTFLKTAQSFINRRVRDPELKAQYEIALLSEMQSASRNLNVEQFARNHIDEEHRETFKAQMSGAGLPIRRNIEKDTSLVTASIRRVKIETARNATLLVPPDMADDGSLSMEPDEGNKSRIIVVDQVKRVTGASGKKVGADDPALADE